LAANKKEAPKKETVRKELEVYVDPAYAHFRIKYKGGGELPGELKGRYTHRELAEEAIQRYLKKRDG
jgi:hypothetical protein